MNPYKPLHKCCDCSDSSNNFEFGNLLVLSKITYVAFQIGFKPIGDASILQRPGPSLQSL